MKDRVYLHHRCLDLVHLGAATFYALLRLRAENNKCEWEFAAVFVGNADDADICDVRVTEEVALEFGGGDLVAADLEEFLEPIHDEHIPILMNDNFVACAHPAIDESLFRPTHIQRHIATEQKAITYA